MYRLLNVSHTKTLIKHPVRMLSSTSPLLERYVGGRRKHAHPWKRNFGPHPNDVGPDKYGGSAKLAEMVARDRVFAEQKPGYYVKDEQGVETFVFVEEMIPEFVVPTRDELNQCKLKPYVSYNVQNITQGPFTEQELFNSVYAEKIINAYQTGEMTDPQSDAEKYLNPNKS